MTNLDAITGQRFPVADGYYIRCRQCDWHKKLRGSIYTPFRYPPTPTYTYNSGFGSCPSCGRKLADVIFAVYSHRIVYVVINHELKVSARLEELEPELYATLREVTDRRCWGLGFDGKPDGSGKRTRHEGVIVWQMCSVYPTTQYKHSKVFQYRKR